MKSIVHPVTVAQAADLAGVTERHFRRLIAAGTGPVRRDDGTLDCLALGEWLRRRSDDDAARLDAEQERARLARQQRLESEQRVRIRGGELVEVDVVVRYTVGMASALVQALSAWPGRLTPALLACDRTATAVAALLGEAVHDARCDLDDALSRAHAAFKAAES